MGKKDKHKKLKGLTLTVPASELSNDRFGTVRSYVQHVLVCTDSKSKACKKGGPAILKAFQAAIKARKLHRQVIVSEIGHVGGCKLGPNVIVYPDGVWYGLVGAEDVAEIVDRHLIGGEVVVRLLRGSREGGPCGDCALLNAPGRLVLETAA